METHFNLFCFKIRQKEEEAGVSNLSDSLSSSSGCRDWVEQIFQSALSIKYIGYGF